MNRIGVIGAGQLGAYIAREAKDLGVHVTVLASAETDSGVGIADAVLYGKTDDVPMARELARLCDVVTYELEDISVPVLEMLQQMDQAGEVTVAPSASILLMLQNKATQKTWLESNGFPTSRFVIVDDPASDANREILRGLGTPFVLKTQRGGYDGLGVQIVNDWADVEKFAGVPCIAEEFIGGKREFSVVAARNHSGETACYPVFEMVFNESGNVLHHVVAPANISEAIAAEARQLALEIVDSLTGVGVFAVELFLNEQGLLVNEISPRVHNTAHLTIEACETSQFEQHARAITDRKLGSVRQTKASAMINVLYEDALHNACEVGDGIVQGPDNTTMHWYGKKTYRPLRKMGHITALGDDVDEALQYAENYWQYLTTIEAPE